jgi:hypothetical protein
MDSALPQAVHPLGEIDDVVSRLSAFWMYHAATQRGFGIGSNNISM